MLGPEALVRAALVLDGLEALALVAGELEVDVLGGHDPDLGRLDHGYRLIVEVEQREPLADLGQRLVGVRRVVGPEAGGGRLVAAQDGIDELRRSTVRAWPSSNGAARSRSRLGAGRPRRCRTGLVRRR